MRTKRKPALLAWGLAILWPTLISASPEYMVVPKYEEVLGANIVQSPYRRAMATSANRVFAQRADNLSWQTLNRATFENEYKVARRISIVPAPETDYHYGNFHSDWVTYTLWENGEYQPYWSRVGSLMNWYDRPAGSDNPCPGQFNSNVQITCYSHGNTGKATGNQVKLIDNQFHRLRTGRMAAQVRMISYTNVPPEYAFRGRYHWLAQSVIANIMIRFTDGGSSWSRGINNHKALGLPNQLVDIPKNVLGIGPVQHRFMAPPTYDVRFDFDYFVNTRLSAEGVVLFCVKTEIRDWQNVNSDDLMNIHLQDRRIWTHQEFCRRKVMTRAEEDTLNYAHFSEALLNRDLRAYVSTRSWGKSKDAIFYHSDAGLTLFSGRDDTSEVLPVTLNADEDIEWYSDSIYEEEAP